MAQALVSPTCPRVVDKVAAVTARLGAILKELGYFAPPVALVVILATKLVWDARIQSQRRKTLPPGPRPWPIIGNLSALVGDKPHRALQELAFEFGGLMYLQLGMSSSIVP